MNADSGGRNRRAHRRQPYAARSTLNPRRPHRQHRSHQLRAHGLFTVCLRTSRFYRRPRGHRPSREGGRKEGQMKTPGAGQSRLREQRARGMPRRLGWLARMIGVDPCRQRGSSLGRMPRTESGSVRGCAMQSHRLRRTAIIGRVGHAPSPGTSQPRTAKTLLKRLQRLPSPGEGLPVDLDPRKIPPQILERPNSPFKNLPPRIRLESLLSRLTARATWHRCLSLVRTGYQSQRTTCPPSPREE